MIPGCNLLRNALDFARMLGDELIGWLASPAATAEVPDGVGPWAHTHTP